MVVMHLVDEWNAGGRAIQDYLGGSGEFDDSEDERDVVGPSSRVVAKS